MKRVLDKRERVRLIATSYLDARFPEKGGGEPHRGKHESRSPVIETKLWGKGSYAEFQVELDRLRSQGPYGRTRAVAVWRVYVEGEKRPDSYRMKCAAEGLGIITHRMPEDNIRVPLEIKENAGFLAGE